MNKAVSFEHESKCLQVGKEIKKAFSDSCKIQALNENEIMIMK